MALLAAMRVPPRHAARRAARRIDRHWLRSTLLTLSLIGLVMGAIGGDLGFSVVFLAVCAVGFGFFYLTVPGGKHFGATVANLLAIYGCLFGYYRTVSFPDAANEPTMIAVCLPLIGFMFGCFRRRRLVSSLIRARRFHELLVLPRLARWLPWLVVVGIGGALAPHFHLTAVQQGIGLLVAMVLVAVVLAWRACDVVLLMLDIASVFEAVSGRLDRLVMPVMAFLTYYALLVVVFGCLYRIAEGGVEGAMFTVQGHPQALSFAEALYFSVTTLATVGYGDIIPTAPLVRALAIMEVVTGQLLLLFGFSEIMRSGGPDTEARRRLHHDVVEPPP